MRPTLWQFAKKRCRRILPPYYVALALFGGFALWQSFLPAPVSGPPAHPTGYVLDWLWLHAVMLHNLYPGYIMTIDPPLWTLALEFHLYILFPVLVEAYRRFPARFVLLALFAFTMVFRYFTGMAVPGTNVAFESVVTNSVFGRCFEFALGMFAAKAVAEWHRDGRFPLRLADGGILIAFFGVTAIDHRFWHLGITSDAKWGLIYAALLLAGSRPHSRLHHLLSARWLVACGIFSYSVYLIHEPLIIALRRPLAAYSLSNPANAALELCVIVPAMLLLGYLFHRLFERPFMNAPRPAAPPAAPVPEISAGGRVQYRIMANSTRRYLDGIRGVLDELSVDEIDNAVQLFWDNYAQGRRVVFCGNGGSAATASHLPADFQKNMHLHGGRPWECLSLVDSVPLLTAWSNDTDYANVFAGQARTWLRPGDLLVAVSGSGNSPNILAAVEAAHEAGAVTLGWSGFGGGRLAHLAQHNIVVPSDNMQMVEDAHMIVGHLIYSALRDRVSAGKG